MGATNSGTKKGSSGDAQLKSLKEQYERAKANLAIERDKLARLRQSKNNSKSSIDYQKSVIETQKKNVDRAKRIYDDYRSSVKPRK